MGLCGQVSASDTQIRWKRKTKSKYKMNELDKWVNDTCYRKMANKLSAMINHTGPHIQVPVPKFEKRQNGFNQSFSDQMDFN